MKFQVGSEKGAFVLLNILGEFIVASKFPKIGNKAPKKLGVKNSTRVSKKVEFYADLKLVKKVANMLNKKSFFPLALG
jgi:hypothetical protein